MTALLHSIRHSPDWKFVGLHAVIVLLLQTIGVEYFQFQRDWTETWQVWRLVTAHWVHVGWTHLAINTVGLAICVMLAAPGWSLGRWFAKSVCLAVGISILLTLQNPGLQWFAGFSGVLFGLYFLAAHDLYSRDRLIALLMAGAVLGKIGLEQYTNYDVDTSDLIGAPVIHDAHLYGFLLAMAIALVSTTYTMNHGPTEHSDRHEKST